MVLPNLEAYYKERDRLVRETEMDYIDACSQAWRTEIDKKKEK